MLKLFFLLLFSIGSFWRIISIHFSHTCYINYFDSLYKLWETTWLIYDSNWSCDCYDPGFHYLHNMSLSLALQFKYKKITTAKHKSIVLESYEPEIDSIAVCHHSFWWFGERVFPNIFSFLVFSRNPKYCLAFQLHGQIYLPYMNSDHIK